MRTLRARRLDLLTPLLLAALGCSPEPRSVLLVTIDTLRADRLGTYGYARDTSPEIDALAEEGVLFERAIAAASTTAPSHASMMTSRFTREHSIGHFNGRSRLETGPTLAERFRDAGYATGAFVGNYLLQPRYGFDRGFDVFDSQLRSRMRGGAMVMERTAEKTTERAIAWLEEVGAKPVFLWVHYQDPHGPYTPPEAIVERFAAPPRPGETPLPVAKAKYGRNGIPPYQQIDGLALPSQYESRYDGEIFFADRSVGALLRAVEDRDPIVLLTADHGESLGEQGIFFDHSHATTPDLAHVPMILRAPGLPPQRRSGLVAHVDVMPTLLDLAGLPVPDDARGLALGRFVRAQKPLPERTVYCDIGDELSVYRSDGFARLVGVSPVLLDVDTIPARAGDGPAGDGSGPRWRAWSWRPDGSWEPASDAEALPDEVRSYLRDPVRPILLDDITPEDVIRLRALGYW